MHKFIALLKRIHSFTEKKDVCLHLRIDKSNLMSGETITLRCFFLAPMLERWEIKRWFKRLYKATKHSFGTEFRDLPSLEIIDGEAIHKALTVCITFYNPYNELCLYAEKPTEITINRVEDWNFDPNSHYWGWRERIEEARAQAWASLLILAHLILRQFNVEYEGNLYWISLIPARFGDFPTPLS